MFWANIYALSPHLDALLKKEVRSRIFSTLSKFSTNAPLFSSHVNQYYEFRIHLTTAMTPCHNFKVYSFCFHHFSQDVSLRELMDQDDIVPECKNQNKVLVDL